MKQPNHYRLEGFVAACAVGLCILTTVVVYPSPSIVHWCEETTKEDK